MSVGGKGETPAAPNYSDVARVQGQQNLEAIRTGAALNRVNQVGPTGSTTYSQDPNNPDHWTQTNTLSGNQQQILNQGEQNQIDLGAIANQRLGQVGQQGEFSSDGLPSQVTGVQQSQFQGSVNAPTSKYGDIDLAQLSNFGNGQVQTGLDYSGANALPGQNDFSAERQRVEDAQYQRETAMLDPQYQQSDDALRTRLLNSGIREGSEAWNNEMGNFERQKQAAYGDARDRAIASGGAEQSRLFGDALAARQQGVNETTTQGNFANSAAGQINQQAASDRAQRLGELLQQGQFGNSAAQQDFSNELAKANLNNQTQSDTFNQGVTNANLQNEGRSTGYNERLTERQLPLQEFLQMYSGQSNPVQSPSVPSAGTPAAGDYQSAANAQYGANLNKYNAQQAANSQNMQALLQLASLFYG